MIKLYSHCQELVNFIIIVTEKGILCFSDRPLVEFQRSSLLPSFDSRDPFIATKEGTVIMPQQHQLFVGNLSFELDENSLQDHFAQFGSITNVHMPIDRETGRKRGFAFITFDNAESIQNALSMDGKELNGRALRVNVAQGKGEKRSSGGGRGGYGGGRGRDY